MVIGPILAATISSVVATGGQAVVRCDGMPGADAGAKLSSCIARLPGAGGVADASRFTGHQTISTDVFSATKKTLRLLLGPATFSIASNVTIPSTVTLVVLDGASLAPSAGKTITIRGAIEAPLRRIFSGKGTAIVTSPQPACAFPQWFGAIGDGMTDNTETINTALQAADNVCFPAGTYVVQPTIRRFEAVSGVKLPGALRVKSNQVITLDNGATIQSKAWAPGDDESAATFAVYSVRNVTIRGGTLRGNYVVGRIYPGRGGAGHHGIHIGNSQNVTVEDVTMRGFWGDGATVSYIGNLPTAPRLDNSRNIHFIDCVAVQNYRNNLSGVGWVGGSIVGGKYLGAEGTAPEAGIDLEPNILTTSYLAGGSSTSKVEDIAIIGAEISGNKNWGIQLLTAQTRRIVIRGCLIRNQVTAGGGIVVQGASDVRIHGNTFGNGGLPNIDLSDAHDVDIAGNTLLDGTPW